MGKILSPEEFRQLPGAATVVYRAPEQTGRPIPIEPDRGIIGAVGDAVKDFGKTFVRPFGEVIGSAYELAGKEAPNLPRLSSPELRDLQSGSSISQIKAKQESGAYTGLDRGAGFVDVLNAISIAPAGVFAKTLGGASKATKAVRTGRSGLSAVASGAGVGVKEGTKWGAAYGVAEALDRGETDLGELLKAGAFSGLVGGAFGGVVGGAAPAIGLGARKAKNLVDDATSGKFFREKAIKQYDDILNMTPTQKRIERKKGVNSAETLADLGLVGDKKGMYDDLVKTLDQKDIELSNVLTASDEVLKVDDLAQSMYKKVDNYKNDISNYKQVKTRIDDAVETMKELNPSGEIKLSDANEIKRGLWNASYDKNGNQVVNDALKDVGDVMKDSIEKATKEIADVKAMNKEMGRLIQAQKALFSALDKNTKSSGILNSRLFSVFIGAGAGGATGGPVGAYGGALAGNQLNNFLRDPRVRTQLAKILMQLANKSDSKSVALRSKLIEILKKAK